MIPNNITKEHLLDAINEIVRDGVPEGRESTKYDVIFKDNKYPPKLIVSIANRICNGSLLEPSDFQAKSTIHFLQKLGFEIIDKDDIFYKRINEIDVDLLNEYFIALDEIIQKIGIKENDQKTVFSVRNEQLSCQLNNRYILTIKRTGKIGFISADIPELSEYKKEVFASGNIYFKTKDINIIKKNIDEIFRASKQEYNAVDVVFTKHDNALFRKAVFDKKYRKMIIEKHSTNYWIFQGNPKVFDVVRYINEYSSHNWTVASHKDKIKIGDKVILWVTGKNAGCYALAEITSELYQGTDLPEEVSYYTDFAKDKYDFDNTFGKTKGDKINIRITHNISKNPFTKDMKNNNGDLAQLKVGHQGTNFSSNESEYNAILNMIENKGSIESEITEFNEQKIMKNPKNQILFGPPGTGKTYRLSHEYFDDYTDNESKRSREELLDELLLENRYTWFDIIAAIIKEKGKVSVNDILNHELIKSKTRVQNGKTPRQTVWAEMLEHGQLGCENIKRNPEGRREPMIIWKDDDSRFDFNNMDVDELIVESVELLNKSQNLLENNATPIKRYEFVTFHQAFSYEDFIEGIKPVMDDETDDVKYEIKSGVFKQICKRAENDPSNKYALFIDEINRGNVANIFGELITLIEPDKRKGMDNALSVKLPYSKSIFSVPKNLDIIGTMNTADRSVEALDTALRRRFEFIEMLPNSSLLTDISCEDINLEDLLNAINGRVEKLLDKDHQIGHSYFMSKGNRISISELRDVFKNKIMPLLQEYFYGDFGKIGLVLGGGFIEENEDKTIFAKFKYDDRDLIDERKVYQISDLTRLSVSDFKSIYKKSE